MSKPHSPALMLLCILLDPHPPIHAEISSPILGFSSVHGAPLTSSSRSLPAQCPRCNRSHHDPSHHHPGPQLLRPLLHHLLRACTIHPPGRRARPPPRRQPLRAALPERGVHGSGEPRREPRSRAGHVPAAAARQQHDQDAGGL